MVLETGFLIFRSTYTLLVLKATVPRHFNVDKCFRFCSAVEIAIIRFIHFYCCQSKAARLSYRNNEVTGRKCRIQRFISGSPQVSAPG